MKWDWLELDSNKRRRQGYTGINEGAKNQPGKTKLKTGRAKGWMDRERDAAKSRVNNELICDGRKRRLQRSAVDCSDD